jgi:hypothetical protein
MRSTFHRLLFVGCCLAAAALVAVTSWATYRLAVPVAHVSPSRSALAVNEGALQETGPERPRLVPTTQAQELDVMAALQARAAAAKRSNEALAIDAAAQEAPVASVAKKYAKSKKRRTARKTKFRAARGRAARLQGAE